MKLKVAVLVMALALICVPSSKIATAQLLPQAVPANRTWFVVKIVGRNKAPFRSESPSGGIEGIRFCNQINSPRDPVTGLLSGKRQYLPIVFTRVWGPALPEIMIALTTNEMLPTVTFEFYRAAPDGKAAIKYQTIVLTNATVSSLRRYIEVPSGSEPPDSRALEDVSLTFQKIEFTDAAGAMASDDWTVVR